MISLRGGVGFVIAGRVGCCCQGCTGCEVRGECLEYALAHDERFGIWGGLSERERRRLKKQAV